MAVTVTHSKTLVSPDSGAEDKVYGADYVSATSHTLNGLGTGVETALGVNIGSAGGVITFNGDAGTPSALVGTNITGTASGLTAGNVTNATFTTALTVNTGTVTLTGNVANTSVLTIGAGAVSVSGSNTGDQTSVTGNAGTVTVADAGADTTTWPLLGTAQTGSLAPATDAGLTYDASTNALTTTTFIGALTGTASGNLVSGGALGTPSSGVLTNCTGTASGLTAGAVTNGVYTTNNLSVMAATTSAQLAGVISDETGSGALVFATSPTLVTPLLGTPTSGTLTNCTGLPEAGITLADNTTNDVSTTKHGLAPKAPNDATKYLNGAGAYAVPASNTSLVYANTTVPAGNTVANTTTETAFTSSYTIAANTLVAGQVIRVKAYGVYGTNAVAPTLDMRVRFGGVSGTLMLDSGAFTTTGAITNGGWMFDGLFIVQTIGATGTIESQGSAEFSTALTTTLSVDIENTAAITVDTTASKEVVLTAQWGTANASNTITLRELTVSIETPASNSGVLGIPINSKSAAYTTVLADANTCIYHPAADTTARTWTIDSNANVPYPIGTAITFDNDTGAGAITIAITSDTLVLISAGTTGSRTLATGGQATALKVTATRWRISGIGLT